MKWILALSILLVSGAAPLMGEEPPPLTELKALIGKPVESPEVQAFTKRYQLQELHRFANTSLVNSKKVHRSRVTRVVYGTFDTFYWIWASGTESDIESPRPHVSPLRVTGVEVFLTLPKNPGPDVMQRYLPEGVALGATAPQIRSTWPRPEHENVDGMGNGYYDYSWPMRDVGDGVLFKFSGGILQSVRYQ